MMLFESFREQMSYYPSYCPYCRRSEPDLRVKCGHSYHYSCLKSQLKGLDGECSECQAQINDFDLYCDILQKSGINEPEEFFLKLSGTTSLNGLAKYLIETEGSPLEEVLLRCNLIFNDELHLFQSNQEDVSKYALLTGNGRIIKHCKGSETRFQIQLPDELFERALENDCMELLTDLYDIDVHPVNFVVQKIPIMIAANSGNYQLMDRLIASGANLEKRHNDFTPLMIACKSADFESTDEKIKFLDHYWDTVFAKSRIKSNEEKSCFLSAIQTNDHKLLDYLLTKRIPKCEGLVSAAIKSRNLGMVKNSMKSARFQFVNKIFLMR